MHVFLAADGRMRVGWRAAFGVVVFVLAELLAGAAASFVPDKHALIVEAVDRTVSLAILLGGLIFLLITVDGVEESALAAMGLGRHGAKRQIAWGLACGVGMVVTCVAVIAASSNMTNYVTIGTHALLRAAIVLWVLGVASMVEEAAFRGYPFQRLVDGIGPVPAAAISSALFGLIHAGNPEVSKLAVGNTILFGALLAVAYLRSGSLWLPWGIHFGWNAALGLIFGLPVSGVDLFASVERMRPTGPEWITGGAYGVEGGSFATLLIAASIPAVYWIGGRVRKASTGVKEVPVTGV